LFILFLLINPRCGRYNIIQEINNKVKQDKNEASLKELRDESHKIAGSAGTYGFKDVSVYSRQIMNLAEEKLKAQFFEGVVKVLKNDFGVSLTKKRLASLSRTNKSKDSM